MPWSSYSLLWFVSTLSLSESLDKNISVINEQHRSLGYGLHIRKKSGCTTLVQINPPICKALPPNCLGSPLIIISIWVYRKAARKPVVKVGQHGTSFQTLLLCFPHIISTNYLCRSSIVILNTLVSWSVGRINNVSMYKLISHTERKLSLSQILGWSYATVIPQQNQ